MRRKNTKFADLCGLALVVVLVFFFAIFNYRIIKGREGNEEIIESLQARLEQLEDKKRNLAISLDESDDKEHIERILREDFLMKKPGEKKVVILTEEEKKVKKEQAEEKSVWQRFLQLFPWID